MEIIEEVDEEQQISEEVRMPTSIHRAKIKPTSWDASMLRRLLAPSVIEDELMKSKHESSNVCNYR